MNSKICFQKSERYCWETPQDFWDKLNNEFGFTLDVCANKENHKCDIYFSEEEDGLSKEWGDNVCWMNPPYGAKISKWVKKAFEESKKQALVVCLLPARTDTRWWWDYCMNGETRFIKGRLRFKGQNTKGELVNYPATFPSAVVIFKKEKKIGETYAIPKSIIEKAERNLNAGNTGAALKQLIQIVNLVKETKKTNE